MNLRRGLKYLGITALCCLGLFALFFLMIAHSASSLFDKCGMSGGPCYGHMIALDLEKELVDEYVDCPNGKIGFIPAKGTSLPILFKIDANSNIVWAYRFNTDSCCGIPMLKIHGMELESSNGGHYIRFFNETYSEPGDFKLTKDFDFDYLCLNSM
ncbi:MAG: hypothetical protein KA138_03360 [Saprospiraceae bacterium]|nr:hypothetical protein [Saprospiraceae bacterium]